MSKPRSRKEQTTTTAGVKAGILIDLTVTALNEEGFGVGSHEGKPVLVMGLLPGEQAKVRITYVGRRENFGDIVRISTPSPYRLSTPPCSRAGFCDGCPLISMHYPGQLEWKKGLVEKEIHSRKSLQKVRIHDIIPSPKQLHYRNSAKLIIGGTFASPSIGIYRRSSHHVIDISDCPLHHPLINRVVNVVKEGIRKGKVPVFSAKSGTGILRYLVVRVSERHNRAMAVFVTARRSYNEVHHLAKYLQKEVPEVDVVVQNVNPSGGNVILGQHDHFLTKDQTIREEIGDIAFSISPRSFFQVNSGGARLVYEKVRELAALDGKEAIVDLYCGIGGISLFLAKSAAEVHGIEVVEAAVADAEKNAMLNGIHNCTFEAGDAAELLRELHEEGRQVDLIVLNPPRKGCDKAALEAAAGIGPAKIVYVSCSPATLARDLDILSGLGYRTREVQPVDMFPQTPHVENIACLSKEKNDRIEVGQHHKPHTKSPKSLAHKKRGASA